MRRVRRIVCLLALMLGVLLADVRGQDVIFRAPPNTVGNTKNTGPTTTPATARSPWRVSATPPPITQPRPS